MAALLAVAGAACPVLAQAGKDQPDDNSLTPERPIGGLQEAKPISAPAKTMTAAKAGAPATLPKLEANEDEVNLSAFSEPVQLSALVAMLAESLNINVSMKGEVPGTVVFNAPVKVKKTEFLALVDALLEQQNYTITPGVAGFYNVHPVGEIAMKLGGERPTTRVIATPNIRPSALQSAITSQLGSVPGLSAGGTTFLDELGVIVVTGTQHKLQVIESLVQQILAESNKQQYIRIELTHVAAPVARDWALALIGQSRGGGGGGGVPPPGGAPAAAAVGVSGSFDNLGDRLTIEPQGNALIFRGVPEEIEKIRKVIAVVDTASVLEFHRYQVGSAAQQVADLARQRGLGEITTIQTMDVRTGARGAGEPALGATLQQRSGGVSFSGGSTMVVDESRGQILYYATTAQHKLMESLISELNIESEEIVIRTYKIRHSKAEEVADMIVSLIRNEAPAATSSLLPEGGRRRDSFNSGSRSTGRNNQQTSTTPSTRQTQPARSGTTAGGNVAGQGELMFDAENAFVVADAKNSQIIVKASRNQQADFERLIQKLDLRRPSVYLEATIVSVTWDDTMRLAFENQLINAGGEGGVLQTNFGLSTLGTNATLTTAKTINPGLSGLTSALLRSDYVPIAVNALQREADARILSKPQLLVDDNESAEIVSLDQQPTATSTTSTGTQTQSGFGGFVDAGTTLSVTPQISGGGYLRLSYEIELSSFTGASTVSGGVPLPPPRLQNNISADSVTIPSDFTVVVGGLTVDSKTKTIVKVPFLGDIPLVGLLFQDRNTGDKKTTLYVFITPRVVRDPADIRLLSQQPKQDVGLPDDGLDLEPTMIETVLPDSFKK